MTIKDIARISGVSVSTVSRVLNDHPDVSPDTRDKIKAIVEKNNYVPNLGARVLSKTETDNIGLIVRGMQNPFYTGIIAEISKGIEEEGYTLVTQQIGSQDDELMSAALMERDKRLRGVIFLGGRLDYTPGQLSGIDVPYVFCSFSNKYGTLDAADYSSVCIDDNQAAYDAVEKLYAHGHRRIAILLSRPDDGSISQMRYEGFARALRDLSLPGEDRFIIAVESYDIEEAYRSTIERLRRGRDFTALFAISDNMAIGAIRAMTDIGCRVPEDCSVISIDGIEISKYLTPRLSTFKQPDKQLGREAVKQIVRLIEDENAANSHTVLPITFWEGETIKQIV